MVVRCQSLIRLTGKSVHSFVGKIICHLLAWRCMKKGFKFISCLPLTHETPGCPRFSTSLQNVYFSFFPVINIQLRICFQITSLNERSLLIGQMSYPLVEAVLQDP